MKDTDNKEGLLSEGIAKAKRVVRRATQTTDSSEKKKETAEEKKTTRGRKPAAKKRRFMRSICQKESFTYRSMSACGRQRMRTGSA